MSGTSEQLRTVHEDLGDANNILLLVPPMDPKEDAGCGSLLKVATPADSTLLFVSLSAGPDDRLNVWRTHVSREPPARCGFVVAGDATRGSGATDGGGIPSKPDDAYRIETVSSPADLTGIGMKISAILEDFAEMESELVVCFHSLTVLLQYTDIQRAFRFLHVITGRMAAVDATAHFHMDPTVHDEQQRNTLLSLFDGVMELNGEGEWIVRSR